MLAHFTAADLVHVSLGTAGIVVLAAYFLLPRWRTWRRASPGAPAWSTPLSDSLLMIGAVCGAVFLGMVVGTSLARLLPGGADPKGAVQQLGATVGTFALVPLAILGATRYVRGAGTPVAPARAPGAPAALDALPAGVLTFFAAHPLAVAAGLGSQWLFEKLEIPLQAQPSVQLLAGDAPPPVRVGFVLVAVFLAPVAEELCFRVGLFRLFRRWLPRWAAIGLSAAAFATLHFNLAGALPLFVLGCVWAHAYDRTGTPVANIVAHALWNLTTVALVLAGWTTVAP